MKITHQFSFRKREQPQLFRMIEKVGIKYNHVRLPNNEVITLRISEDDPAWPEFKKWTDESNILHGYETRFSDEEILDAEWVRVTSAYAHGYPQPEDSWVTRPNNLTVVCRTCGMYKQVSPFHIKEEPNLRKWQFLSLEWTGGILFTLPLVIGQLEFNEIEGFETWEVIIHKTGLPAKTVKQLFTPITTLAGLIDTSEEPQSICPECGNTKYGYHRRGRMKYRREAMPSSADIVQTFEWFGAGQGHFAYKEILISNRFTRLILDNQWKGLELKPIELL